MSKETLEWLNANTLIGYTAARGTAWHYRASMQGEEANHYPGPVPVDDVRRRLFSWEALSRPIYVEDPVTGGLATVPERQAIVRSDTGHVMGIFSDAYEPHPYVEWLVNTISRLLDDDLSIGSAGLLKGERSPGSRWRCPRTSPPLKASSSGHTSSGRPHSTALWRPPSRESSQTWCATTRWPPASPSTASR